MQKNLYYSDKNSDTIILSDSLGIVLYNLKEKKEIYRTRHLEVNGNELIKINNYIFALAAIQ